MAFSSEEKRREYDRLYYSAHKDAIKKSRRKCIEANKEHYKEYSRNYYIAHRDKYLEKSRQRRLANKDEINRKRREKYRDAALGESEKYKKMLERNREYIKLWREKHPGYNTEYRRRRVEKEMQLTYSTSIQ